MGVHRHLCISNSPQPENSKNQGFKATHNHATVPPTLPRGQEKMWGKRSRSLTTIARGGKPEATENTRTIHQDPAPDQPAPNSCNLSPTQSADSENACGWSAMQCYPSEQHNTIGCKLVRDCGKSELVYYQKKAHWAAWTAAML